MDDGVALLFRLLLPLYVIWIAITGTVARASLWFTGRSQRGVLRLDPEAWLALAASGAAVGGFLGISAAFPAVSAGRVAVGVPLLLATVGMLGVASLVVALVMLYLWYRAAP